MPSLPCDAVVWPQGARFKDTGQGLRAQQSLHARLTNGVFLQLHIAAENQHLL